MHSLYKFLSKNTLAGKLFLLVGLLFLASCSQFIKKDSQNNVLARVGESYLYNDEVNSLLLDNMSLEDSATFVNSYINNWAAKQLLISKAELNLSEKKLKEYDKLVQDYKTELYTRAYKEALVFRSSDSIVTDRQLSDFYDKGKENFKLKESIARVRFITLPVGFLNKSEVRKRMKRFSAEDVKYLDSISVQFKAINLNDSIWVSQARVLKQIPPLAKKKFNKYLNYSQFFELRDSIGLYLGKVVQYKRVNQVAPLSYIKPTIKQVLLSRRKMNYLRKLETELLDEAIKDNEFEVFRRQ